MKLFPQPLLRRAAELGLVPRSVLARITAYLAALYVALALVRALLHATGNDGAAALLSGWVTGLGFAVLCLGFILFVRWVRRRVMWRLRNRLIITYVFIGVIPVALLLGMALLAGYLFVGQFATFLATSDLRTELNSLKIANDELAAQIAAELRSGIAPQRAAEMVRTAEPLDPTGPRSVTFWFRGRGFMIQRSAESPTEAAAPPAWLQKELSTAANHDFQGFVISDGRLRLRAVRELQAGDDRLIVASGAIVSSSMLSRLALNLGEITIHNSDEITAERKAKGRPRVVVGDRAVGAPLASGGKLAPGSLWDSEVAFFSVLDARDWSNGESRPLIMTVSTRKSLLYARLVSTLGELSSVLVVVLYIVAAVFAVIELLALLVGIRLTRTMTFAVSELYRATQRVNRGDFSHRISVHSADQLAALETSFNSMTENIERLLAEEQEKQRIENELTIAQEVQEQLFPKQVTQLETLEVYGLCRPARTVSGDYYDFLPLGHERLGIAVGDISGKGISAALLMATLHSAVRSFLVLHAHAEAGAVPALAAGGASYSRLAAREEIDPSEVSPARWLSLLNRHLYRSTPIEKYATLFLAAYDGPSRTLTYSNGGHLPPLILGAEGSLRRLETGGMVIGLFDNMTYEESTVQLHPGDIFVAYSDGITEPENDFGEFGEQHLIELIRENAALPLERIAEEVTAAVKDWIGGAEQPDDITLVLARVQ